jgi:hypothetical protein
MRQFLANWAAGTKKPAGRAGFWRVFSGPVEPRSPSLEQSRPGVEVPPPQPRIGARSDGRAGGSVVRKGGAIGHVRANWLKQQGFVKA